MRAIPLPPRFAYLAEQLPQLFTFMMQTLNDVHQQFAEYFAEPGLKPYLYTLSRKMSEGHICMFTGDLDPEQLPEAYRNLTGKNPGAHTHLVGHSGEYKPFI
ncbi:MAG: hypothetical protein EOP49_47575, partial [Sphingobacteriales bacterium]